MKSEQIEEEFPFPAEALIFLVQLESDKVLDKEQADVFDDLIRKYLNARARLFDENRVE
jgi:hypothetical protein